ncbi:hypothetical protein [Paraburkholderia antibiotica]|uniref:Uncharacterized protein n=1 Tax=Paraburkholderia antibiotica TaxID=2728839 RepID=A0A7Y0FFB3_9BURK|nr:hypothetical protein [Paraburkholderia antibiotica]NML34068.1 hypothetical protein [Paraburkholderia antibiotica]
MATLAHRAFKVVLFIGLCLLSIRYIPFSYEWSPREARAWFAASALLGVHDPDDLYFLVWVTIELIVAVLAYIGIMKLWRWYRPR